MAGKTFVPGEKLRAADVNNLRSKLDPIINYELVTTQALSGSVINIDTSAGYERLFIFIGDADTTAAATTNFTNLYLTINNDTSNAYSMTSTTGLGSEVSASVFSAGGASQDTFLSVQMEGLSGSIVTIALDSKFSTSTANVGTGRRGFYVGSASTSSIQITNPSYDWTSGSVVVYGT